MLIVFRSDASSADHARAASLIDSLGYQSQVLAGAQRTAIAVLGNDGRLDGARFSALPGVEEVIHVSRPYRMVAREWRREPTVVRLPGGLSVGDAEILVVAGPCAVESESQIFATAQAVKAAGAVALRAGAFKPRTSPYAFQGLGAAGLELLAAVRRETGLLLVTEALDEAGLERVAEVADIVQIGARNMQNFALLKRAGRIGKPILLKRGIAASLNDLLLSAEYVLSEGNPDVILCERGIRSSDGATRNVFDLNAIPVVKSLSHLPIMADPSHATGKRALVPAAARAAVAAGADGLLIEVHRNPDEALSDGAQSLYPEQFALLMTQLRGIAGAIGRTLAGSR
ncbi:MAG TPA: 3-deoxy-7-phosphoheptulonate synthase [Gemmatimonadales bacterium]|jgi:3-deoxy-7-phosphoheptulonate synthase|nr:3-deoxy-7-phosphoheptulonate synthase [Gemmatimonadales bacterium]